MGKPKYAWPPREGAEPAPFRLAKDAFETAYVTDLLTHTKGNVSAAARLADKERKDFYDLVNRAGLVPEDFRV